MKTKIKVEKEVNIAILKVLAEVRYWEDATVNGVEDEDGSLIPCKNGDTWSPEIDIDSGKIMNWEIGKKAEIHYKVCDQCGWELRDESGVVLSAEDGYVPDTLCPKDSGYGDYIIMDVDENGNIADWKFDVNDFMREAD